MFEALFAAMQAEEAISSTEIENGPMEPEDRYVTKMSMIFPDVPKGLWEKYYDEKE